jgi:DNA-binding SARP family transcriptional activator/Tfp pilus assembly protein PilF
MRIQLFGSFAVWRRGQPIPPQAWSQEKTKALLKILASEAGRVFKHDELIKWLWPEAEPSRAQRTLKNRMAELRRLLEPRLRRGQASRFIETHREGYRFKPEADCLIDLQEFVRHAQAGKAAEHAGHYEQAIASYEQSLRWCEPGELLAEDRYEEWAIPIRHRWEQEFLDVLSRLADCHARLGHYRRALAHCRRSLEKDPYREGGWRQLMLYYYLAGSPSEAVSAYESCRQKLNELEREPSQKTQELYEHIKAGHIPGIDQFYPPPPLVRHEIPYALSPGSIPFVGRRAEYARLVSSLEQARKGRGCCVLIGGEAGVGKTRLAQEFISYARERCKIQLFQGHCHELIQLAYQPWSEAVREGLAKLKREELQAIPPLWLAEVAKIAPELRVRMPELPENPPLPPEQERLRFFEGLARFFLSFVERKHAPKPLLIFLDDLQWADAASVDFLNYLLARLETKPILIVGTYRSEEVSEDHPLLKLVRAWEPKNLLHTLPLGRLTAMEVEELLRKLPLALKRFDLFCQRLYEETEGIPLFLIATLQHFFEEGALKITGKVWVTDIEDISSNYRELLIPPTVKDLIVRRLSRLSEPEQKLLELASVIGRTFEFPLLERAWEGNGDCLRTLEGLIRAHVLVERQDRYAFSHDKIREVVYEGMSLPRRQQLHRRVLEALENVYAGESETQAVLRAQHAYHGGQWKKALEYSLQALTKAVKEYRHQEGLHLVEWGLESAQRLEAAGEDRAHLTGLRFELLAHREAIFDLQGRRQEQERDLEQMQSLAERLGDQRKLALVFQKRGKMYWRLGRFLEAEETTQKALKLHADLKDQQAQGDCLNTLGLVYRSLGRPQEALRCHQQALEHYEQIGDRQGQGYSLSHIGVVYWGWGQWDEALRYHRQALQIFQEIGDRKGQGDALGNIGIVYSQSGREEAALPFHQQALAIYREIGNRQSEGHTLHNLGSVYMGLSHYEEGLRYYQQALAIRREVGDRRGQGAALSAIGRYYYGSLGQYDEALPYLQEAMQIRQEIADKWGQGEVQYNLGFIYHGLGRYEEALRCYQQAAKIFQDTEDRTYEAYSLAGLGDVYRELRKPAEAVECYSQAGTIAEELGLHALQAYCLSAGGMARLGLGERESALHDSTRAIQMLEGGQIRENPQEIYLNHFKILCAHGRDAEAMDYLKKAYDAVMQCAERLKAPKARESFLKNVKTHREIIKEYRARALA